MAKKDMLIMLTHLWFVGYLLSDNADPVYFLLAYMGLLLAFFWRR